MRTVKSQRHGVSKAVTCCLSCGLVAGLLACAGLAGERMIYEQGGVRIGLQADPTVARAKTEVGNAHPSMLSGADVRSLLGVVQVSGYSGTLTGLFQNPKPVALLTDEQLKEYADYIAEAFRQAKPTERIVFSFPKPDVAYSEDRTEGALFVRDRYLHLVVTDHSSILHADTGGGEVRDVRDTKAMKLRVAGPAHPAAVPDADEPNWPPFETIHISLNVGEVLALRSAGSPVLSSRERATPIVPAAVPGPSQQDLQNQIRELTNSNLELRQRLDEQMKRMKDATEEMNRLRLDLERSRSGAQSPRKAPSP